MAVVTKQRIIHARAARPREIKVVKVSVCDFCGKEPKPHRRLTTCEICNREMCRSCSSNAACDPCLRLYDDKYEPMLRDLGSEYEKNKAAIREAWIAESLRDSEMEAVR